MEEDSNPKKIEMLRDLKKYDYCIILPDEAFKSIWDIVMTFFLFFTFFITPYRIAFEEESLLLILID